MVSTLIIVDNKITNYLKSDKFKEDFSEQVKKDTWDKDLPMVYMNDEGWIVRHWKDGKIEKIKQMKYL